MFDLKSPSLAIHFDDLSDLDEMNNLVTSCKAELYSKLSTEMTKPQVAVVSSNEAFLWGRRDDPNMFWGFVTALS